MGLRQLTAEMVRRSKVAELGLNPDAMDLTSIEAISGALRRAASMHCPCTGLTLVRSVVQPLRLLVNDLEELRTKVEQTLEAMIAHGDILEHFEVDIEDKKENASLLYTAPPSFVVRKSGTVMLLGVTRDQSSALPSYLQERIEYQKYLRCLRPNPDEDLSMDLSEFGLHRLSFENWLRTPRQESPSEYLSRVERQLVAAQPSYDVPGLRLLNPESSVRYYQDRWTSARSKSGRFVARRSQAYGADLWCFVQLRDGVTERLIDFPLKDQSWRACDEAWRVQLAIDALRGNAQKFRVISDSTTTRIVQFFSPVPMWARRRWNAVGDPVHKTQCLFAYRMSESEIAEELNFARQVLWLDELPKSTS